MFGINLRRHEPAPGVGFNRSNPLTVGLIGWIDPITGFNKNVVTVTAPPTLVGSVFRNAGRPRPEIGINLGRVRGYAATYGTGTSDRIQRNEIVALPHTVTIAAWGFCNGDGGSGVGRICDISAGAIRLHVTSSGVEANSYTFGRNWSGATGVEWSFVGRQTGVWQLVAVSYDGTSTTNDPQTYINGLPISNTERNGPPSGLISNAITITIGNRSGLDRNWDGMIHDLMVWGRVLSPTEHYLVYLNMYQMLNPASGSLIVGTEEEEQNQIIAYRAVSSNLRW